MPLYRIGGKLELLCINAVGGMSLDPAIRQLTTSVDATHVMHRMDDAVMLAMVTPPDRQRRLTPKLKGAGLPVIAYACEECGYVEFYAASSVDPKTWDPDA